MSGPTQTTTRALGPVDIEPRAELPPKGHDHDTGEERIAALVKKAVR